MSSGAAVAAEERACARSSRYDGDQPEAFAPMSVTLTLEDEIDLSRGDMLVSPDNAPAVSRRFRAMVVWLHAEPLEVGQTYLGEAYRATDEDSRDCRFCHRVNVNTLARENATICR